METINTKKFNFFLKGNNGKAVLLIHGITGTPSEMRYLGSRINKAGFTVLCNILPRHCNTLGELKKITWQEIEEACVKDLMTLKKEHMRVFVGGLSMGALMAVHLAYNFPADVSGIIALAPTLFYDGWALPKRKFLLHFVWHIPYLRNKVDIKEGWPYGLKDEYLREKIYRFYKSAYTDKFDNKVLLFGSPFFPVVCLYQLYLFNKVVKKEFSSVKTPILLLHAQEDDMTSVKNSQYVFKNIASVDKSLVVLDDSYHMISIDKQKDRVVEEAVKFLHNHP
jgi:carboxylesterase